MSAWEYDDNGLISNELSIGNHQEANHFVLNTDKRWLAVVQLNGELMAHTQESIMRAFAISPKLLNLSRVHGTLDAAAQLLESFIDGSIEDGERREAADVVENLISWAMEFRAAIGLAPDEFLRKRSPEKNRPVGG